MAYRDLILAEPTLLAYYEFDTTNGQLVDSGPSGYTLGSSGPASSSVTGIQTQGIWCPNGGSLSASLTDPQANTFQTPAQSLEVWVKYRGAGTNLVYATQFCPGEPANPLQLTFLFPSFGDALASIAPDSLGAINEHTSVINTATPLWEQFVYTYNGAGNSILYRNGVAVATTAAASATLACPDDGASTLTIVGGDVYLDEVSWYSSQLSAAAVAAHYAAATAVTSQRTLSLRARINARATRTTTLRARIAPASVTQARILTARARIEQVESSADAVAETWSVTDEVSAFSRGLTVQASSLGSFAIGQTLTVHAGYDLDRMTIMKGIIEEISVSREVNDTSYTIVCRDQGSKEVDSRLITRCWNLSPPNSSLTAHQILAQAAAVANVVLGVIDFPDYPVSGTFIVEQRSFLEILQELMEPWNQFPSVQYVTQMREGVLNVVRIDWVSPSSGGTVLGRQHLKQLTRGQQTYRETPNLTAFTEFIVTGATWTVTILDAVGPQTRIEYFRDEKTGSVREQAGSQAEWIITETVNTETVCGDKITARVQEQYLTTFSTVGASDGATTLQLRTTETWTYFEPANRNSIGFTTDQVSICPSSTALPLAQESIHEGVDDADHVFKERQRNRTDYYYDASNNLAVEVTAQRELITGLWTLTNLSTRFHSQVTGGTIQSQLTTFALDAGQPSLLGVDHQQVAGSRPTPSNEHGRVATFQARAPQVTVGVTNDPIFGTINRLDFGTQERFLWTYENGHLFQHECEVIRDLAIAEKNLQDGTYRWETVDFQMVLNPNLFVGTSLSIEVEDSVFHDYVLESVTHEFNTNSAVTKARAKRLTTDNF